MCLKVLSIIFFYKGHCEDLSVRLEQHNSGQTDSIKPYIPFELVYFEEFDTIEEAITREKYLKSGVEKEFLKSLVP